jgi:hypothetical protein
VFLNTTREQIFQNFKYLGDIDRIDLVTKQNQQGKGYICVFIHFIAWYQDEHAMKTRELVENGGEFRVFYDKNNFWRVLEQRKREYKSHNLNHSPSPSPRPVLNHSPRPVPRPVLNHSPSPSPIKVVANMQQEIVDIYPSPESRREKYGKKVPQSPLMNNVDTNLLTKERNFAKKEDILEKKIEKLMKEKDKLAKEKEVLVLAREKSDEKRRLVVDKDVATNEDVEKDEAKQDEAKQVNELANQFATELFIESNQNVLCQVDTATDSSQSSEYRDIDDRDSDVQLIASIDYGITIMPPKRKVVRKKVVKNVQLVSGSIVVLA